MEQENLKDCGRAVCKVIILYLVIQIVLYPVFFALFNTFSLNAATVGYLTNVICVMISTVYLVKRYQKKWNLQIPWQIKEKFEKKDLVKYILMGLGISFFSSLFVTVLSELLKDVLILETPDFSAKYGMIDNIIINLSVIFVAPITEELVFRGLFLKKLQKYGLWYSSVIVSLLFALIHGNIPQGVGAFFVSLILCAVTLKSNSLIPAIIIHMLNNLIGQLSDYNNEVWQTIITVVIIVVMIIGIILLISELLKKRSSLHLEYSMSMFFNNVWGIIFLIVIILSIISTIKII